MKKGTIILLASIVLWVLNNEYFGWNLEPSSKAEAIIGLIAIGGIVVGGTMNIRRAFGLDKVKEAPKKSSNKDAEINISSDNPVLKKAIDFAEENCGKCTHANILDFLLCVSSYARGYIAAQKEHDEANKTDNKEEEEKKEEQDKPVT